MRMIDDPMSSRECALEIEGTLYSQLLFCAIGKISRPSSSNLTTLFMTHGW
jgi:hypothetical protein